jgi:hypothetical protein
LCLGTPAFAHAISLVLKAPREINKPHQSWGLIIWACPYIWNVNPNGFLLALLIVARIVLHAHIIYI